MRVRQAQKEDTRERLLSAGAAVIKRGGFAATGVDQLMQAAGLSGAALYAYFPGKAALLAAIVAVELPRSLRRLTGEADEPAETALRRCLDRYLTLEHVQHPERGCLLPALAAEMARADAALLQQVHAACQPFEDFWAAKLQRRDAGNVLLAQCVGAITMARLCPDAAQQQVLLAASKAWLLTSLLPAPVSAAPAATGATAAHS